MGKYKILIKKSASEELGKIQKKDLLKIIERIQKLSLDPRPQGFQKLSVLERYRLRQGNYRIIYSVSDKNYEIHIIKIGHRREIFRN
ncbi:MAG: type II toxin-antitoxin system RelE/ParE family toxin [Candidatus Aminicenantes bacterium]|nr:type II toxin-antitoxin system RelE/ParE family toxin [Candidatus Aminicenantes bacterium]